VAINVHIPTPMPPIFYAGWDGQGTELVSKHLPVDTNTHTNFTTTLMHGVRHSLDIAEQVGTLYPLYMAGFEAIHRCYF
jgi:hypothetical protein